MEEWKMRVGVLSEEAMTRLSVMLDNATCGWRQLANTLAEQPNFRYR